MSKLRKKGYQGCCQVWTVLVLTVSHEQWRRIMKHRYGFCDRFWDVFFCFVAMGGKRE